jgi:hypothetical protein
MSRDMAVLAELDELTTYLRDGADRLARALRALEADTYGRTNSGGGSGGSRRPSIARPVSVPPVALRAGHPGASRRDEKGPGGSPSHDEADNARKANELLSA